jgi:hypothetical protein
MDLDEIRPQFESALREFSEVDTRITAEMQRRDALLMILQGFGKLYPELVDELARVMARGGHPYVATPATDDRPRGQAAVKRVLGEHPHKWWTVADMVTELGRRGWLPDVGDAGPATRTALDRLALAKVGVIKGRRKDGGPVAYIYRPPGPKEVA